MKSFEHHNNLQFLRAIKPFFRKPNTSPSPIVFILGGMLLMFLFFMASCRASYAYTDEQIVNAIYLAEGGKNAKYPYGIRSIKCESKEACRRICKNTIRNNRKRYIQNESSRNMEFIEFLGLRYCPIKGNSLSAADNRLNKNWVRNVNYFLQKGF